MPIDEGSKLFIKGGVFYGEISKWEGSGSREKTYDHGISGIVGVGGEFNVFSNFAVRGEMEWIPHAGDGGEVYPHTANVDVMFASVSLIWHFLGLAPEAPLFSTGSGLSSMTGFYLGGGAMGVSFDGGERRRGSGDHKNIITDIDIGYKGFLGYRFHKYAAVEVGYNHYNDARGSNADALGPDTFDAQGISFSLLGIIPVSDRTSVLIKVGGIYGWLEEFAPGNSPTSAFGTRFGESGLSVLVGTGLNFDISEYISTRVEVEWTPDFAEGRAGPRNNLGRDRDTGETADLDIITSSVNLIFWLR